MACQNTCNFFVNSHIVLLSQTENNTSTEDGIHGKGSFSIPDFTLTLLPSGSIISLKKYNYPFVSEPKPQFLPVTMI